MPERLTPGLPVDELQAELRDLLSLAVVGDHVRWVLSGDGAVELREWLADVVPQWRALAEEVAKHLVAQGVPPDGRVRSLTNDIPLNWVPGGWLRTDEGRLLVANRLRRLAEWARYRRSQTRDPETARVLNTVCVTLEHSLKNASLHGPPLRSS